MTSPTDRARDRDRNAAVKTVDAALAAGRIVPADRDKRVEEIRRAQTMQDITVQVGDLASTVAAASTAPTVVPAAAVSAPSSAASTPSTPPSTPTSAFGQQQASWPLVGYGPSQPAGQAGQPFNLAQVAQFSAAARAGRRIGGIIAAVALVSVVVPIAAVVIGLVSHHDSFTYDTGTPTNDATYLPGQDPGQGGINLHTVDGYNALVSAVSDRTGGTSVYSVVLYPRYAVVDVPDQTGPGHYQSFYYDGELTMEDFKNSTSDAPIDLNDVDPNLMIQALETVRARVSDPTQWYCVGDSPQGDAARLACYASNEYGDSSYVVYGLDGTLIYDSAQGGRAPA